MSKQSRLLLIGLGACFLVKPPSLSAQSQKAQAWLAACNQGTARDCYDLARGYRAAKEGLQRDRDKAVLYYHRACDQGLAAACQELGEALVLAREEGLGPDSAGALEVLGRACELEPEGKAGRTAGLLGGRGRCQGVIALYQQIHPRTRVDSVAAKRIVRNACQRAQDKAACIMLSAGWSSFPDSVALPDSIKRALADALAHDLARRDSTRVGDSTRLADSLAQAERDRVKQEARVTAATRRVNGKASDRLVALRRTLRAGCDAGEAKACADLADMLEKGRGGPQDRTQAAAVRRKACAIEPGFCRKP